MSAQLLTARAQDVLVVECASASAPEERCIEYTLAPLHSATGDRLEVIVVGADKTEQKKTAEALRRSQEERADLLASEHAAKEAARVSRSIFTNLAHESRTPVAGIVSRRPASSLDSLPLRPTLPRPADRSLGDPSDSPTRCGPFVGEDCFPHRIGYRGRQGEVHRGWHEQLLEQLVFLFAEMSSPG